VEYWIELIPEKSNTKKKKPEIVRREVEILGLQERIDGIFTTIEDRFELKDQRNIQKKLAVFRDALTGGAFQTNAVKVDHNRARDIQMKASELFVLIREASDRSSRFRLTRFW
jgi:hypothetical protein